MIMNRLTLSSLGTLKDALIFIIQPGFPTVAASSGTATASFPHHLFQETWLVGDHQAFTEVVLCAA